MVRTRPPGRVGEILDAAVEVFQQVGFQRARMADIATVAGISPGLLYQYAESKEALFHLVLLREVGMPVDESDLPAKASPTATVETEVQTALASTSRRPALAAALAGRRSPRDVRAELDAIVGEHYDWLFRYRRLIRIVERSALDRPAIAELFYEKGRAPFIDDLARYISRRVKSGHLRPVPDAAVAARFVLETIAWFAMHRFGDHDGAQIDDDVARDTVLHMIASALVVEG
jgi:AcrR family transcriptional regulator